LKPVELGTSWLQPRKIVEMDFFNDRERLRQLDLTILDD
jgi:hypothetical protein